MEAEHCREGAHLGPGRGEEDHLCNWGRKQHCCLWRGLAARVLGAAAREENFRYVSHNAVPLMCVKKVGCVGCLWLQLDHLLCLWLS